MNVSLDFWLGCLAGIFSLLLPSFAIMLFALRRAQPEPPCEEELDLLRHQFGVRTP